MVAVAVVTAKRVDGANEDAFDAIMRPRDAAREMGAIVNIVIVTVPRTGIEAHWERIVKVVGEVELSLS